MYPLRPLMDKEHKELTLPFKKALVSIFRVLDEDNDGYLSQEDFLRFHKGRLTRGFSIAIESDSITTNVPEDF